MNTYKLMIAPEEAVELVLQKYPGNWSEANLAKVTSTFGVRLVVMEADHPESFLFYLRLKEECERIQEIAIRVMWDGMDTPFCFDHWGLLTEWTIGADKVAIKKINLHGYAL